MPQQAVGMVGQLASGGRDLTQVSDLTLAEQLAQVPPLAGIVDQVVAGVHDAFSLAIADTFWIGLLATVIALVVVATGLRDIPLRSHGLDPIDARIEAGGGDEPVARSATVA